VAKSSDSRSLREGGAGDGTKRELAAVAREVDGAGHELLPRAALALDEHRRPLARDFSHEVEDPAMRGLLLQVVEPYWRLIFRRRIEFSRSSSSPG